MGGTLTLGNESATPNRNILSIGVVLIAVLAAGTALWAFATVETTTAPSDPCQDEFDACVRRNPHTPHTSQWDRYVAGCHDNYEECVASSRRE